MRICCLASAKVCVLAAVAMMLSSCGRHGDFDISSADAFSASCVRAAGSLGERLQVTPHTVAALFAAYASPPVAPQVTREMDSTQVIPVVEVEEMNATEVSRACAEMALHPEPFAEVDSAEAVRIGIANIVLALSSEDSRLKSARAEIVRHRDGSQQEMRRLREAMDHYAPRGVTFRIIPDGGAVVPSVVVEATNAVGRPITAFLLTIRLVQPDGAFIGSGKLRYVPVVPLAPGIDTNYTINLSGIKGLDTSEVLSYSGAVRVVVSLDDLVVGGKMLLGGLHLDPLDKARIDAIDVVRNGVARYRDYIRHLREVQITVLG